MLSPCALMLSANELISCLLSGLMGKYQQTQLDDEVERAKHFLACAPLTVTSKIKIFAEVCLIPK